MTQSELYELKQKILDAIQASFGAVANGPSFTHKFDKIFAEAFKKMEEKDHGGTERRQENGVEE
jgi:hypothetical protein